jgi:hypothetical protein
MATPKTLRTLFLKMLSAPPAEWGFEDVAARDAWIRERFDNTQAAQKKKAAEKAKRAARPKRAAKKK